MNECDLRLPLQVCDNLAASARGHPWWGRLWLAILDDALSKFPATQPPQEVVLAKDLSQR